MIEQAAIQAKMQNQGPLSQQQVQRSQVGSMGHQGSAPPKLPLLAEISNRVGSNIGSVIDATGKIRERLDEILGSEPPQGGSPKGSNPAASAQAQTLLQQCDMLEDVLKDLHHQIARLGAI